MNTTAVLCCAHIETRLQPITNILILLFPLSFSYMVLDSTSPPVALHVDMFGSRSVVAAAPAPGTTLV